jgi:hypothetical protein
MERKTRTYPVTVIVKDGEIPELTMIRLFDTLQKGCDDQSTDFAVGSMIEEGHIQQVVCGTEKPKL